MYVLKPVTITDSNLTSNIPEPDTGEAEWLVGSTYAAGDEVISLATHTKYKSNAGGNIGNDPDSETYDSDGIGANWTIYGKSNRYSMFSGVIGTQSTESTQIQVDFDASVIVNGLSVFNVSAQTANVTMDDPIDGEVYNKDIDMRDNSQVVDWYTYFLEPIVEKRRFSLWDLPGYPNATVTLTLGSTGDVACGECVIGQQINLGAALYGTGFQLLNFNVTERDAFGNIVKTTDRRTAKLAKYNVHTPTARSEYVFNVLDDLRDTACVWSGSVDNDKTLIYGYHADARVNYSTPSLDDITIEVEGLT